MSEQILHEGHAELVALVREQFAMLKAGASNGMARRLSRTEDVILGVLADEARRTDQVARDNLRLQQRLDGLGADLGDDWDDDGPSVPRGGDLGWASGR